MEGKLIKVREHYYLTVNEILYAEIGGHPLKSINKGLSLKNCQAIENGYDLDELANTTYKEFPTDPMKMYNRDTQCFKKRKAYINGFKKALEILGDKKFSENDIRKAIEFDKYHYEYGNITAGKRDDEKEEFIQSLQQNEFDVEIEMEQYVKYVPKYLETIYPTGGVRPKLDADGCLILKRI